MKFKAADPDENFSLARFLSDGGRWEIGLRPMLFGVRVSLGLVGGIGPAVDYCAGAKLDDQLNILSVVLAVLKKLPEEVNEREIRNSFPQQKIKPMFNDPACWEKLLALAERNP